MTLGIHIRHFLSKINGVPDLSTESKTIFSFLGSIVESATIAYDKPITMADVKCRATVHNNTCIGEIGIRVCTENNRIGRECVERGVGGIISDWVGATWDHCDYVYH
jgi:hypothetical protein